MKVVISEFIDEAALDQFDADTHIVYNPALQTNLAAFHSALADADALIVRNRTQVNAAALAVAPRLKVIGRLGVGLDNIDLEVCAARGIVVHPATGANALPVAEYVIASMLILLRNSFSANAAMLRGEWPRNALMGAEAAGRTMGLVGFGGIARDVAARARAMGMAIAAYDPHLPSDSPAWTGVLRCSLNELLVQSDVLSLHLPYTPETRRIIGAEQLRRTKRGAIVINTARGGVLDEEALAQTLREGHLSGAALDVFETEPLTREAAVRFEGLPNIILTPHIAGLTHEANTRVSAITVQNVIRELSARGST